MLTPTDFLKINVDASFVASNCETGIGGVCRNEEGRWVQGFKIKMHLPNAYDAELTAIKEGLNWAIANNWNKFILISDCKKAVDVIISQDQNRDHLTHVINYCRTDFFRPKKRSFP